MKVFGRPCSAMAFRSAFTSLSTSQSTASIDSSFEAVRLEDTDDFHLEKVVTNPVIRGPIILSSYKSQIPKPKSQSQPAASGFGLWASGFGLWGLGFGIWGLGFGIWRCHAPAIHRRRHDRLPVRNSARHACHRSAITREGDDCRRDDMPIDAGGQLVATLRKAAVRIGEVFVAALDRALAASGADVLVVGTDESLLTAMAGFLDARRETRAGGSVA